MNLKEKQEKKIKEEKNVFDKYVFGSFLFLSLKQKNSFAYGHL